RCVSLQELHVLPSGDICGCIAIVVGRGSECGGGAGGRGGSLIRVHKVTRCDNLLSRGIENKTVGPGSERVFSKLHRAPFPNIRMRKGGSGSAFRIFIELSQQAAIN